MLTPSDLRATLGAGLRPRDAAKMLRCSQKTVYRAAYAYSIEIPERDGRLRTREEWLAAYEQHGPSLRGMSRGLDMSRSYIARRLEELGIKGWADRPGARHDLYPPVPDLEAAE